MINERKRAKFGKTTVCACESLAPPFFLIAQMPANQVHSQVDTKAKDHYGFD
jgi:hypothetical protein